MARISINIVTWNGMRYLPEALESISNQTFQDIEIVIIDNGSTDGTVEYIRDNFTGITLLRNMRNLGFAHGHNQGIRLVLNRWQNQDLENSFILVTNQDIILRKDFLEKMISVAETAPRAASFGGKLFKAFFATAEDNIEDSIKSDTLDSTGLRCFRSHRFVDRGAGERDQGQYDAEREVFGVSGAIMMLRASALASVRYKDEFFDENYFAYKEDVDLAWRLRLAGWGSLYVPEAIAHHYRGAYSAERAGWMETWRSRKSRSMIVKLNSYVNHYLTIIKNAHIRNIILRLPWIIAYELKKNIYLFFLEPRVFWKGLFKLSVKLPDALRKRKFILSRAMPTGPLRHSFSEASRQAAARPAEIRKWFK
ncbi:MAG: glycosyltransferase family 2 protein [Patescibacteria group bacterium]|nr:glycosyltransferase family 2 protein [Patescibacteria group bacterium]